MPRGRRVMARGRDVVARRCVPLLATLRAPVRLCVLLSCSLGLLACGLIPRGEVSCHDGQDNDGDGATDCDDIDCRASHYCAPAHEDDVDLTPLEPAVAPTPRPDDSGTGEPPAGPDDDDGGTLPPEQGCGGQACLPGQSCIDGDCIGDPDAPQPPTVQTVGIQVTSIRLTTARDADNRCFDSTCLRPCPSSLVCFDCCLPDLYVAVYVDGEPYEVDDRVVATTPVEDVMSIDPWDAGELVVTFSEDQQVELRVFDYDGGRDDFIFACPLPEVPSPPVSCSGPMGTRATTPSTLNYNVRAL